jgi:uncharacterized membrane protein
LRFPSDLPGWRINDGPPAAGSPATGRDFNAGGRAYYFALAAPAWFIHPLLFIAATLLITLVLIRRQLFSATAHDIAEHAESLSAEPGDGKSPTAE